MFAAVLIFAAPFAEISTFLGDHSKLSLGISKRQEGCVGYFAVEEQTSVGVGLIIRKDTILGLNDSWDEKKVLVDFVCVNCGQYEKNALPIGPKRFATAGTVQYRTGVPQCGRHRREGYLGSMPVQTGYRVHWPYLKSPTDDARNERWLDRGLNSHPWGYETNALLLEQPALCDSWYRTIWDSKLGREQRFSMRTSSPRWILRFNVGSNGTSFSLASAKVSHGWRKKSEAWTHNPDATKQTHYCLSNPYCATAGTIQHETTNS